MDKIDKTLLNEIQSRFPVDPRPYRVIGERIGLEENEVLQRVAELRSSGVIRRVGASIDSRRLGFVSTLVAAQVPPDKLDEFVEMVGSAPGVTHNYLRRHAYNVWFTLITSSEEEKLRTLEELTDLTGISLLELPASRIFKIRVDFRF
jgi:siroheme decarboxylase